MNRFAVDLSGKWYLKFDPKNVGKKEGWFKRNAHQILQGALEAMVPRIWQEFKPDLRGGVGWYCRSFSVGRELEGKILRLKFWAVDYLAEVWINGGYAGCHEGGYTPFELDISELVNYGNSNWLVVRVLDPPRYGRPFAIGLPGWEDSFSGEIEGYDFMDVPEGTQQWVEGFNFGGIWQPVELVANEKVYIHSIFAQPDLSKGSVKTRLEIRNHSNKEVDVELLLTVHPWKETEAIRGEEERSLTLTPGANALEISVDVEDHHPWSPDDPFLYTLAVVLRMEGKAIDSLRERFGIREFTVQDGYFHLNGKRTFIKGGMYQGTYPKTLVVPPTKNFAYDEMKLAKEGGINFLRCWVKPTPPSILNAADELGIMIQEEPPLSLMQDSAHLNMRAVREVEEMVSRDRNHPCIVIWNMINELAPAAKIMDELCLVARKMDPTRLVTENAGGHSRYYLPHSEEGVSYLTEHAYPYAPISTGVYRYWNGRGEPGKLFFVTEFGHGGIPDLQRLLASYGEDFNPELEDYRGFYHLREMLRKNFESSEFKKAFKDFDAFAEATQTLQSNAVQSLMEAMRSNPAVGGYAITCFHDSNAFEVDGVVDFWRKDRKKAYYAMKAINQPLNLVVHCTPHNLRSGEQVKIKVTLVNEHILTGTQELRMEVLSPSEKTVFQEKRTFKSRPWVTLLLQRNVKISGLSGCYRIRAEVGDVGASSVHKENCINVIHADDMRFPERPFMLFDPQGRLRPFLKKRGIGFVDFTTEPKEPGVIVIPAFTNLWKQPQEFVKFIWLFNLIRRGCTVIFLGLPTESFQDLAAEGQAMAGANTGPFLQLSGASVWQIFPFMEAGSSMGRVWAYSWGLRAPVSGTCVVDHPIFEGLPTGCLMDRDYANIVPRYNIKTSVVPTETVGQAVQVFTHGKGKIILSSLNIIPFLGKDAFSENILSNMVRYADEKLPEKLARSLPQDLELARFNEAQYKEVWEKYLQGAIGKE